MSSQIGYVICLANATSKANIIHWSSIKWKWVTRIILAAKLYGIALGFDIGAVIKTTLGKMLGSTLPLILYIDSKSLYNCLAKLGTTQDKQQMVDVMNLRQLYEQQEITEVKWIYKYHNLTDFMTKAKPSSALKTLINSNYINISTTEYVEWVSMKLVSISI